jgi:streptomycin 6-kinase
MSSDPRARDWSATAVSRFLERAERWSLSLDGPAYDGGYASLVAPVRTAGGEPAVLKLQFPHRECVHEAAALRHWDGRGAVRLLDHDPDRDALLVERCEPGTPLDTLELDSALDAAVEILERLLVPAHDLVFDTLADEARGWTVELRQAWERHGRPVEPELLERICAMALELAASQQGEPVLLHQDLHAGNILRAKREPWLVIDPKPLLGERAFAVVALVRGDEFGLSEQLVRHRLDRLSADLSLDRARVRDWTAVQTFAWGMDSPARERDMRTVRWLLEM